MFALVDCNNFYVSCERVFNPLIIGKPVVVLSNNDGCIISRSNEAKALGIKMGEPLFMAREVVDANDVHVFSSNYALYGDMSRRVMNYLSSLVKAVEIYSIDECFLDVDDVTELTAFGILTRANVLKRTHIPVCVGIAPTKTLAKLANRIAKKSESGVCVLDTWEKIQSALNSTDVGDIWGVGSAYNKKLQSNGIEKAIDFIKLDANWIRLHLGGVVGQRMHLELRGCSVLRLQQSEDGNSIRDSITNSRSFGQPISSFVEIQSALVTFTTRALVKLRKQNSLATVVTFFVATSRFKDDTSPRYYSKTYTLQTPSSYTPEFIKLANLALLSFPINKDYVKAGVSLDRFSSLDSIQTNMFDVVPGDLRRNRTDLMTVVDNLNDTYGQFTVVYASTLPLKGESTTSWAAKTEFMSPRYTSSFNELKRLK